MAVKALLAARKLELKEKKLEAVKRELDERKLECRSLEDDIASLADDASDEAVEGVQAKVDAVLGTIDTLTATVDTLNTEIQALTDEINNANYAGEAENPTPPDGGKQSAPTEGERSVTHMPYSRREKYALERAALSERAQTKEYKGFLDKIRALKGGASERAAGSVIGVEESIPLIMLDPILDKVRDTSRLYPHVRVISMNGTGKLIVSDKAPMGEWVECCSPATEIQLTLSVITLDCYMVSSKLTICDAMLADSDIALAAYIEDGIASGIAQALDNAILNNDDVGAPQGIIPIIEAAADQILTIDPANIPAGLTEYSELMQYAAYFGDDSDIDTEKVVAVMDRKTFAKHVLRFTLAVNAAGQVVGQPFSYKYLADGTPIVISKFMPANTMLIGDFSKYLLGERQQATFARSEHEKFSANQTVFRGNARYDGKITDSDAFMLVKYV